MGMYTSYLSWKKLGIFCLFVCVMCWGYVGKGQCPSQYTYLVFHSQQEIDDFAANYPNCTEVSGLTIGYPYALDSTDIIDLSPLNQLTSIRGSNMYITRNPNLKNLDGLENLVSVERDLSIYNNRSLENINGLTNLDSIGESLNIARNDSLKNLDGLSSLVYIQDGMSLYSNPQLESINGLSNLNVTVSDFYLSIWINPMLENINALSGISGTLEYARIDENARLKNLDGLRNLGGLRGSLHIKNNSQLENLNGLVGIDSIGGIFEIINNSSLKEINGLSNLKEVSSEIRLEDNSSLENIDGLIGLKISTNHELKIIDGFNKLTFIDGGGGLFINTHLKLETIKGFSELAHIGNTFLITSNPFMTSLPSFSKLETIGGSFHFNNYRYLEELEGFDRLVSIGGHFLFGGNSVHSIQGFNNLQSVGQVFQITHNPNLQEANCFANLTSIGKDCWIFDNPRLQNLNAFSNLTSLGDTLKIKENGQLRDFTGLCALFQAGYSGEFIQERNATTFSPTEDCLTCSITSIQSVDPPICDPTTNTFSQSLEITFSDAPSTGQLNMNGQLFDIDSSPQQIRLTNLPVDGKGVDITAFFSDMPTCSLEVAEAFTAPRKLIAEAGEDRTICKGEHDELVAHAYGGVSPYTFSWSGQASQNINISPDETTSYTVQITDDIGCMAEDEVTIHVSAPVDVNFTAPADICFTESLLNGLGGGTPTGGSYQGPGVQDDGNGTTYTFDPTAAGVGIHTIEYTINSPELWTQKGVDLDGWVAEDELGQAVSLSADGNRMAVSAPNTTETGMMLDLSASMNGTEMRGRHWGKTSWERQQMIALDAPFLSQPMVIGWR